MSQTARRTSPTAMSYPTIANVPAPNVPFFSPLEEPVSGTAVEPQPNGKPVPLLFKPLKVRGIELHNRMVLSPLCQYSAFEGKMTPWHFAHLGGIISRGPGLAFTEAMAVRPEGRITPEDLGLWNDEQEAVFRELVQFAHSQGQKVAVQLAHSGRKGSTVAPWLHASATASEAAGGWPAHLVAPSAIPWQDSLPTPTELTKEGIKDIVTAFATAARRAVRAGVSVVEIHSAHGYLLNSFISPVSNHRTDEYGGSFENRIRALFEVIDAVRASIPTSMPLAVRISGTDWLESDPAVPSWKIEDSIRLAGLLPAHGVDILDVSSSGNSPHQSILGAGKPGYQVHLAEAIKKAHGDKILVGTVGSITTGTLAQEILDAGKADLIFVGRGFQKNPGLVWAFAEELGVEIRVARQIEWGFKGRHRPRESRL